MALASPEGQVRSTELILRLAHDQMDQRAKWILEVAVGAGDVRGAELLIEELDQHLALGRPDRRAHQAQEEVVDHLGSRGQPAARTIAARSIWAASRGIGLTLAIAICQPR